MNGADSEKVIQELNRRFSQSLPEFYSRRIIFWYDEDREFEDKVNCLEEAREDGLGHKIAEIELSDAKLVALTGTNNFAIKKLLTVDDKSSNYCVYCPVVYPDLENWLLSIQLYSEEFRADLVSMWLDEMGIENTAKTRYDEVVSGIAARKARSERLEEFIKTLKAQGGVLTDFDESLWSSMVDYVTVGRKKEMTVTFKGGSEIEA